MVHRQVKLPFAREDWRNLSPAEQTERLKVYLKSDREQGFELSKAPLLRVTVIQLAETDVVSELVRMLGADTEDSTARRHARELRRAA